MDFRPISVIAVELGVNIDDIYCATCTSNNNCVCTVTGQTIENERCQFCSRWNGDANKLEKYHKGEI